MWNVCQVDQEFHHVIHSPTSQLWTKNVKVTWMSVPQKQPPGFVMRLDGDSRGRVPHQDCDHCPNRPASELPKHLERLNWTI